VRRSTERQEVEGTFVTRLEPNPELAHGLSIAWDEAEDRTETLQSIPSPYGDSKSPDRAVAAILELVERAS
jgi:UDP-N-acetylglucosamine 2-epimerase (non-hydrolysing)